MSGNILHKEFIRTLSFNLLPRYLTNFFFIPVMPNKVKQKEYSQECLMRAIAEIKDGMSYRKVSEKYNIPRSTLSDKCNEKSSLSALKPGPSTYLSEEQEIRLLKWMTSMSDIGNGIARNRIPLIVKEILDEAEKNGYVIPPQKKFQDNKPSLCWVNGFLKRHPRFSARTPENLKFRLTEGNVI